MSELSASALADLAGVTRLAKACEQAGLPMDGIATAIRAGRLSFAFLEAQQYQRYAARSVQTYRQVSQETGVPLELLGRALESAGFAWSAPDDPIREDKLELVPVLQLVAATGILDLAWTTRIGRAWADGMRLVAKAENEAYHARFERPVLESGAGLDRRPGRARRGRAGRVPGRAGPPHRPCLWRRARQVAGRRGDVPLPRTRRRRAGRAGHGGGAPRRLGCRRPMSGWPPGRYSSRGPPDPYGC
jgi:hypothetical protein